MLTSASLILTSGAVGGSLSSEVPRSAPLPDGSGLACASGELDSSSSAFASASAPTHCPATAWFAGCGAFRSRLLPLLRLPVLRPRDSVGAGSLATTASPSLPSSASLGLTSWPASEDPSEGVAAVSSSSEKVDTKASESASSRSVVTAAWGCPGKAGVAGGECGAQGQ